MRFAAFDFETATHRPDSACQIGVAFFEDGEIVDHLDQLIRPPSLYFSPRCVAVHGIQPHQVRNAPTWDEFWEQHGARFEDYPLVAHNATFDTNVLLSTLKAYGLPCPYVEYHCSRMIAQRAWPGRPSYALKSSADILGIEFQHHDALEDARVCGRIVLAAAEAVGAADLSQLESKLGLSRGRLQFGVRFPPTRLRKSVAQTAEHQATASDASTEQQTASLSIDGAVAQLSRQILSCCAGSLPLVGKHVVLAGTLFRLERTAAVGLLEQLGAVVQSKINLQTQYVICGPGAGSEDAASAEQHIDVERRQAEGQRIRFLSQRQLLSLLPGGAAQLRRSLDLA